MCPHVGGPMALQHILKVQLKLPGAPKKGSQVQEHTAERGRHLLWDCSGAEGGRGSARLPRGELTLSLPTLCRLPLGPC